MLRWMLIFFGLLGMAFQVQAQFFHQRKISKKWIVGVHSAGSGYNAVDPVTNEIKKVSNVFVEPYAGYFFNKNFGIGLVGGYSFTRSNFEEDKDFYEIGVFGRYFYPIGFKPEFLQRLLVLSEVSYRISTYQGINSSEYIESNNLEYDILTIVPIGLEFNLFKGLYFELSTEWLIHSIDYAPLGYRIGLEYHL